MLRLIVVAIIAILFLNGISFAGQYKDLSNNVQAIEEAYSLLEKDCNNTSCQNRYMEAFPKTADEFVDLFHYRETKVGVKFAELNDGHKYILKLKCVLISQPQKVIPTLLNIAKGVPQVVSRSFCKFPLLDGLD